MDSVWRLIPEDQSSATSSISVTPATLSATGATRAASISTSSTPNPKNLGLRRKRAPNPKDRAVVARGPAPPASGRRSRPTPPPELRDAGVTARKSLGQHFLTDRRIF